MGIKQYLVIASYILAVAAGWHAHSWYDGYKRAKEADAIIVARVTQETESNKAAAATEKKEADDEKQAKQSDEVITQHIETRPDVFSCVVPAVGVRDLQQAVTTHTRARQPD